MNNKLNGKVKFFNSTKGFGFIKDKESEKELEVDCFGYNLYYGSSYDGGYDSY